MPKKRDENETAFDTLQEVLRRDAERMQFSFDQKLETTEVYDSRLGKEEMGYKDKADLFCPFHQNLFLGRILAADIFIEVFFYIKFLPWQRSMSFNLRAAKDTQGKWRWLYSPVVQLPK
jgi:hypothetical protein